MINKKGDNVLGPRGKTWLSAVSWLLLFMLGLWPAAGNAAGSAGFASGDWRLPILAVSTQTPMEAQMLGEQPSTSQSLSPPSYLQQISPGLEQNGQGTTLRLPQNFRISFRYNSERPNKMAEGLIQPPLLFKYSMDYCLLPNLQVGLSGFLYQSPADQLTFLQQRNLVLGWGPSLKYDLGRWSFTIRSQIEKGGPEAGQGLQNWFRVWYAF